MALLHTTVFFPRVVHAARRLLQLLGYIRPGCVLPLRAAALVAECVSSEAQKKVQHVGCMSFQKQTMTRNKRWRLV